jgi:hypothetical protein
MKEVLKSFIPLFITVTCLSLLVFICCQQIYRLSANDPQIQMAEDAKIYLSGGGSYSFTDQNKTEMSQSLAPFLMLYDKDKKLISYSAVLHGNPPVLPVGVLDNAKKKGETRLTWQPEEGVRNATVVVYYKGIKEGYAAVGRSLTEVEKRIQMLTIYVAAFWLGTNIMLFAAIWFLNSNLFLKSKKLH